MNDHTHRSDDDLFATAEARIQEHRTASANLRFVDPAGQPLPGLTASVRLARHEFKLGANAFRIGTIEDPGLQQAYEDRFSALLNYATLPFYWGGYEPQPGQTSEQRLLKMAEWCRQRGITAKGHPLVWHEVFPQWAQALDDAQVLSRLQARVTAIVTSFCGLIDLWDVVNEATVSHRFGNAVGRWVAQAGAATVVAQVLAWAHTANPGATLLYNDFNISDDFEALTRALIERGAPLNTIGIQSHMHKEVWPLEKIWRVCETYASFGLPLHFTEATILSGRLKAQDDDDWHHVHTDWHTTSEGEQYQLAYGQQFYTLLFSHPAVEAITWWDFSDNRSWQGAPAGLVRKDMSPKPLYEWLMDAFHKHWCTDLSLIADAAGCVSTRAFFGDYEVRGRTLSGATITGTFTLARLGNRELTVTMG